jgi:ribosomal protein S18 acetylase RimI-like enzyme
MGENCRSVREDRNVVVRTLAEEDRVWSGDSLRRTWGSTSVARQGALVDAAGLPGLVALLDDLPVGLLTYARREDDIEVVTVHAEHEGVGVGRALMDELLRRARAMGVGRIWLVTTNDNIRAIDFYQRWGMDLVGLVADGVTASRRVKPSIPMVAENGIPVRHELVFQLVLD